MAESVFYLCKQSAPVPDRNDSLLYVDKDDKERGYKPEFLKEELPSSFRGFVICTVCEGLMRDACGVGDPQVFMCSVCADGKSVIALPPNRDVIKSMTVFCPLKSRGCDWEGTISSAETHMDECEYFLVECELACGLVLKRQDMERHTSTSCPFREIICEHCTEYHREQDTNLHLGACTKLPLTCVNGCGVIVERIQMDAHLEMCPNGVLACEYKRYGCEVTFMRKHLDKHTEEDRLIHMELLMQSGIKNVTAEIEKVNLENQSIKQQLTQVIEENSAQKECLAKLTDEYLSLKNELKVMKEESKRENAKMSEEQKKFVEDTIKPLLERVEFMSAKQTLLQTELAEKASSNKVESLTTNCTSLQYLTTFRQKRIFKLTRVSDKGAKCLSENWVDLKLPTVKIQAINYQQVEKADKELVMRFTGLFCVSTNTTVKVCIVLLNYTCDLILKLYEASVVLKESGHSATRPGSIRRARGTELSHVLAEIPWIEIKKEGTCVGDCIYIQVYYDREE